MIAFAVLVAATMLLAPQPWLNRNGSVEASGTVIVAGSLPTAREGTSAAYDGTYAWVFGGKEGGKRLSDIVRYDPVTDQAVLIGTKLPSGRESTSAVFVDGSAYIIGGRNTGDARISAIIKFTPDGNGGGVLVPFAPKLPTGREFTAAGTDGKAIFVFGGSDGRFLNEIVRIDPTSGTVTTMDAKLPTGRILMSAASAGRYIYLFGGQDGSGRVDDVLRYDTKENVLLDFGSLPTGRADTSAVFAAPYVYVFGGRDDNGRLNDILRYDPSTKSFGELDWSFRTERESTSAIATGSDGDVAVVFGGRNGGHRLAEIVEVSLDSGAPQNLVARTGQAAGEIDLSWEAPAEGSLSGPILGYNIYVGMKSGQRAFLADVAPDQLSFEHTGLPNSVIRFYTVTAFSADGEGGHSNEAFAATKRGPPPPLPSPREGMESAWIKGRAFVFGGYQSADAAAASSLDATGMGEDGETEGEIALNEIVEYDPESGTVEVLGTELPPKCCASSESDGEFVYLFGGDGGDERCCEGGEGRSTVVDDVMELTDISPDQSIFRFDPDTGELTLLDAVIPTPLCCAQAVFDGDVIWLFGGSEEERCCEDEAALAEPGDSLSDIWIFDPETETLSDSGFDLPIPKCCFAAEEEGGFIYLFGGSNDADERCCEEILGAAESMEETTDGQIIRFDPSTGESVVLGATLPVTMCCLSSADDDEGTIYLFGGEGEEERCCEESLDAGAADLGGVQYDHILAFDVATETIRILDETLPSARSDTSAVWNGQRAFIFGGDVDGTSTKEVVAFEPLAPQAATATAGEGRGEITLTWGVPSDDSQVSLAGAVYRIYVTTSDGAHTVDQAATEDRVFVDAGLGDGETRSYRVTVVTANDESPSSRDTSATTFTVPSEPQNLAVDQDFVAGTITLSWDPPATTGGVALTHYLVYKHTDVQPIEETIVVPATETTWTDDECIFPALQCFYTVTAWNVVGESAHSDEVSAIGTKLPTDLGFVGPIQPQDVAPSREPARATFPGPAAMTG